LPIAIATIPEKTLVTHAKALRRKEDHSTSSDKINNQSNIELLLCGLANLRDVKLNKSFVGGTEIAMLSSLFQSSTIPVLEQVVNFTEARHGVLAGNIANLDTPGYKTRDLSPALFQERLKEAIETRHQPKAPAYDAESLGLARTYDSQRHEDRQLAAFRNVEDSMKSILRHDEGDVSMEQQINEIVKNQQQHNLAIGIMSAQFRLLRAAITERVA
jgi:flagellar basal-body rod protein FlgB